MKKTHHSAEAEPSVERSDNTSTSIRISSALSRCRALTLKPSLERRKGAVAVWDRTQASLRRQGGWRTNSQEWDEMLACRRKSCGELCLLLRCSYLISASTIILIPRTSLTKANQFLGFPSEVSEKLHKNSPKTKSFRPDPSHVITILVRMWNNLSALRNTQGCCSYVHLSVWMDGCGWNWVWESPIHIFQNGNTDWLYLNLVNWVSWRGGGGVRGEPTLDILSERTVSLNHPSPISAYQLQVSFHNQLFTSHVHKCNICPPTGQ